MLTAEEIASSSGATLEIVSAGEGALVVKRTLPPDAGLDQPHVHLDYVERWTLETGRATAALDGLPRYLGPRDELAVPIGCPHVNPYNRGTDKVVLWQAFEPATEGARRYVATLAATLRADRDKHGDLPPLLALALFQATHAHTFLVGPPRWLQRGLLFPAGAVLARLLGLRVAPPLPLN